VVDLRKGKYNDWSLRNRISLKDLFENDNIYMDRVIAVSGWVRTIRMGGADSFAFVLVYDGSTYNELQIIVSESCPGFQHILDGSASISASILAIGPIILSQGREQKFEMSCHDFRLLGPSSGTDFPLSKGKHTTAFLRTIGHFRPRSYLISSITRVRNSLAYATHMFFQERGFYYIIPQLLLHLIVKELVKCFKLQQF